MKTLTPFATENTSLIAAYSARLASKLEMKAVLDEAEIARREAAELIKSHSDFLANMNHELRTPLNAIIGFSTMIADVENFTLSDEQKVSYAEYILQSADLLLSHINTLLEAAAVEGGDLAFAPGEIDFREILGETVKRARVASNAKGIRIDDRSEQPVPAWGDGERLSQAVDHVLRTAIRLAPENSRILVRAIVDANGNAEIAIRDRSTGLAPEVVERTLNAFGSVYGGLDQSLSGPSIGLAIAKTFVELQGGMFHLKSKPGEGTLVRICLSSAMNHGADDIMKNEEIEHVAAAQRKAV